MAKQNEEKKVRLFENDMTFTGKHATYMKYLVNEAQLYDDYIDVYMNAAVFGYLYCEKRDKDNDSTDRARIYADAFSNHRDECVFLYRIITLLDDRDMEIEERLNRAFRCDAESNKQDIVQECLDSFNSYVRGGIEYMYKQFTTGCTSKDDYIRQSYEVSRKFKESLEGVSYEDKIKKLLGK
ncbi:MAG: hypothetical protein K2N61_07280 [Lachnospiraceae bacterium]|nr:hypothetical protein [Lachnospiraceae bacterium]